MAFIQLFSYFYSFKKGLLCHVLFVIYEQFVPNSSLITTVNNKKAFNLNNEIF